jgi:hypothetical protein
MILFITATVAFASGVAAGLLIRHGREAVEDWRAGRRMRLRAQNGGRKKSTP